MSTFSEKNIKTAIGRQGLTLAVYSECDSTNLRALEHARKRGCADAVFIADRQTAGRGRLGRRFISPGGRGIYLSILTGSIPHDGDAVSVTAYAAVTVCRAIERLTSLKPMIKWVNDIYVGGKKVAGILAQGIVDAQTSSLSGVVMGVGINVLGDELDPEIENIATTLEREGDAPDRVELAAEIIREFLDNLPSVGSAECADEYRRRSFLVGERVNVIHTNKAYPAKVLGITDRCELILEKDGGEREILATGEVSVRKIADSEP